MPISDWMPGIAAVGALLRTRTRDSNGNEVGTFTALTTPTDVQVGELIATAAGVVSGVVGEDLPDKLWEQAKAVVVLRTAMSIELSYYPEQVALGRSPYAQYREMYLDELAALRAAVDDAGGDPPGGVDGLAEPEEPVYDFPSGVYPLDPLLGVPTSGYVPWSGGVFQ